MKARPSAPEPDRRGEQRRPARHPHLERVLADPPITVRAFVPADRPALLAGRDEVFHRFMGAGSPDPAPVACVEVDDTVIGWIDYDSDRDWLGEREVNVGYSVFAPHRGNGYGTRALVLLCRYLAELEPPLVPILLIDDRNRPSLSVAARAGFRPAGQIDGQLRFEPAP